jgi:methylenetetrahydrofolate reductase (NADPH)
MSIVAEQAEQAAALSSDDTRRLALLAESSIEISPRDELAGDRLGDLLAPGKTVFVNHPGTATLHDIAAACSRLRRAGFVPVPHLAARRLDGFTQVRDFVERVTGDAGVGAALITGGDPERPVGPFEGAYDLLTSGAIDPGLIDGVIFGAHPEGHPALSRPTLDAVLAEKLMAARGLGFEASLVTQFGFSVPAITAWLTALRARGIGCPVRIGLAGPASVATLASYAVRCGIGASLRTLGRGHTAFARILAEATPDPLIDGLLAVETPDVHFEGLHIFTFGGVSHTAEWLRRSLA